MTEFDALLTNNAGAIVMAGGFIYYLIRKDKDNKEIITGFNRTIQNHLNHSDKTYLKVAGALQKLCEKIDKK